MKKTHCAVLFAVVCACVSPVRAQEAEDDSGLVALSAQYSAIEIQRARELVGQAGSSRFTRLTLVPADLTTTGLEYLDTFKSLVGVEGCSFISFGDSMADSYRSVGYHTAYSLMQKFGVSGYALNNFRNTMLMAVEGDAQITPYNDAYWFTGHVILKPGASVTWWNQVNPNGVYADQMGVFYAAQPEGGLISMLVSTNGGPFGEVAQVDGYSGEQAGTGGFFKVSLPPSYYRIKAMGVTGTNHIIGPYTLDSQSLGVQMVFADQGGIPLNAVTNVSRSIRDTVFGAFKNPLIMWHMKEGGSVATAERMRECESWWSSCMTNVSVIYIGSPWMSVDTNSTYTLDQNAVVRAIAQEYHRTYYDLMTPAVSYEYMRDHGYMSDEVHQNSAGNAFLQPYLWYGTGLYAVGLSNAISSIVANGDGTADVSYYASPGASYSLEHSYDVTSGQWMNLTPTQPTFLTGAWVTNVITLPNESGFFRLRLSPP